MQRGLVRAALVLPALRRLVSFTNHHSYLNSVADIQHGRVVGQRVARVALRERLAERSGRKKGPRHAASWALGLANWASDTSGRCYSVFAAARRSCVRAAPTGNGA